MRCRVGAVSIALAPRHFQRVHALVAWVEAETPSAGVKHEIAAGGHATFAGCVDASVTKWRGYALSAPVPIVFPFRMILAGPPVSVNSRDDVRLNSWKMIVVAHARPRVGTAPPTSEACCFSIGHYFERGGEPDADNVVKPVQDALEQIVYVNDQQIVDSIGYKRDLRAGIRFRLEDPALPWALRTMLPFVHVQVSLASDPHFERI